MDADHNRCVITLAGELDAVGEAAILGTGKAMELIDMNEHKGAHPRGGSNGCGAVYSGGRSDAGRLRGAGEARGAGDLEALPDPDFLL